MNSVLITGAAGFLGTNLSEHFLHRGYQVYGIDNFCTGQRRNAESLSRDSNFHFFELDVCEPQSWKKIEGIQVQNLLHFASPASPPKYSNLSLETLRVNSEGLRLALTFAQSQAARLVFASTSEVYGDPQISPQPETYNGNVNPTGARSCYDESKRFGEALVHSFNQVHNGGHGIVRLFNSYGPKMDLQDGRVVTNFIQQILLKQPISIFGDGSQTRSFCYVDDTVEGIVRYLESSETEPMNIGSDTEITILDLIKEFESLTNQTLNKISLPLPKDDPKKRKPDLTRAGTRLGWSPKISLRLGLGRTMESFAQDLVKSK